MKNKINVNISPNPLDLQTLHCSQNDTGERKFYFTLHNNGEVIDTTDISDPIFEPFDVHKGGTEQLLPINTDDPTTSPIIADIQYPDEEKTEQEFTYRESPTTIDGKALIEKIKGNTLVWNQLLKESNFNLSYIKDGITLTKVNNSYAFDVSGTLSSTGGDKNYYAFVMTGANSIPIEANHIYVFLDSSKYFSLYAYGATFLTNYVDVVGNGGYVLKASTSGNLALTLRKDNIALDTAINERIYLGIFDITKMFGTEIADEIYAMDRADVGSGVAYFRSLYPLPYYQYGQKLLSFNGSGIKTVGFNQIDESTLEIGSINQTTGENSNTTTSFRNSGYIDVMPNTSYFFKDTRISYYVANLFFYDSNKNYIGQTQILDTQKTGGYVFTTPSNCFFFRYRNYNGSTSLTEIPSGTSVLNLSGSENGKYEPYQTSTLNIPVSTYFPNGMRSAGSVFDELTNSKTITRVGEVDLGTLDWTVSSGTGGFYNVTRLSNFKVASTTAERADGLICSKYPFSTVLTYNSNMEDKSMLRGNSNSAQIYIKDTAYGNDANAFKTAMNGVYLYYELAEEQVTEFTHASLICEEGESTLYQDDDLLVCECTQDFSKDSGFKDCKIKFTSDDGVVYSNKIQLHIERKP